MQSVKMLVNRIKNLVLGPKEEWGVIAGEEMTATALIKDYLLVLAAIPAVAKFLGMWIIGVPIPFGGGVVRLTFFESLISSIVFYVLTAAGIWAFAQILKFIAPRFSSSNDNVKTLKVAVFMAAPYLFAGVLYVIPSLSVITLLVGIYCLYILYVGLPAVLDTPQEKTLPFIIVSVVAAILLSIIVSAITGPLTNAFGPDFYPRAF
ncbi:DUF1282 family protein [bacterium]|nr:DUF1282 family protein [bacterium]